jgi:manganese-dependent inorganic pyrophosphatase
MAVAADLIASLDQRVDEILEADVLQLDRDARLDEATVDLMNSPLREAIVLDDDGKPIGIVTRSNVAVHPHRKVILVDHNETRQAAAGIEDAEVVEIIDHHRIADVSTVKPIKFLNLPVGSSATIVTLEAQRLGIEPPKHIAAVLLSAIMTDTIILKSPTATAIDKQVVDYLAGILEVDPTGYGIEIFAYRGGDADMPIDKLVSADSKEFAYGDGMVLIAQHETTNLESVMAREPEIREYLRKRVAERGYACALLMLTDIIAEGSQFICEGDRRIVNRAFGINCTGKGGTWMPGILSRKKQVATRILEA